MKHPTKQKLFSFWVSDAEQAAIDLLSFSLGCSKSEAVRRAVTSMTLAIDHRDADREQ